MCIEIMIGNNRRFGILHVVEAQALQVPGGKQRRLTQKDIFFFFEMTFCKARLRNYNDLPLFLQIGPTDNR